MPKKPTQLDLRYLADKFNSSDLIRLIGQAVDLAQRAKETHAMEAIRAGILCLIAKQNLPHGSFQEWITKNVTVTFFGGRPSYETVHRYMRVATAFGQQTAITPQESIFLEEGADETPGAGDNLRAAVRTWINNRSLSTIYREEGIVRERDPHQIHTPADQTPAESMQLELKGIIDSLDSASAHLRVLTSTGNWEKLPKNKRFEFLQDALPTVENLALHTAWSPAERVALEQRLVGITTALRAGKEAQR